MPNIHLRIASRESRLAMAQSEWVAARLTEMHPGIAVSIIGMTTRGDQILDKPLAQIGGKGLFIKELEVALEENRADIAVHSMKDVPMSLPEGFAAITVGEREDVRDALISNRFASLAALPQGAIVGTSSLRRECQLRKARPDLIIRALRGNVNTRLAKLDAGEFDAIILAAAGLTRLGLANRIRASLDAAAFIPAIAQGALGIEFRADHEDVRTLLAPFENRRTTAIVAAERAFGRRLTASCDVPLGASATIENDQLSINGFIAMPDGSRMLRDRVAGGFLDADTLGTTLANRLLASGAGEILTALAQRHSARGD